MLAHIDVFLPGRRLRLIHLPSPALPAGDSAIVDDLMLEPRAASDAAARARLRLPGRAALRAGAAPPSCGLAAVAGAAEGLSREEHGRRRRPGGCEMTGFPAARGDRRLRPVARDALGRRLPIDDSTTLLFAALLLGIVNGFLRPIAIVLTFPITHRHARPLPAGDQRGMLGAGGLAPAGFPHRRASGRRCWGALIVGLTGWVGSWFIGSKGLERIRKALTARSPPPPDGIARRRRTRHCRRRAASCRDGIAGPGRRR